MNKLIVLIEDLRCLGSPDVKLFSRESDFDAYVTDVMMEALGLRGNSRRPSSPDDEWQAIHAALEAGNTSEAWYLFTQGLFGDVDAVTVRHPEDRYSVIRKEAFPPILSGRELATILASLRYAQNHPDVLTGPHFDRADDALSACEIDTLCERLNK